MTGDRSAQRLRAVVLAALMIFSVFAGSVAFAGTSVAAGNTDGSVGVSINSAGNTATVTVDDADLNTDSGSRQSRVVNVQSTSEPVQGSTTAESDAPDGGSHEFAVAGLGAVADRTGDGAITAADFTLQGAADESITGVTEKSGQYYVTVSDAGAPDDGAAETVTYTQQTTMVTGSDTADGTTTTVTTGLPLGDMNGDGVIDTADVRIDGASDETVTSVTPNPDGTADITVSDSGAPSDSSQEFLSYVPSETVTVVETGPDTGTFTGSVSLTETDSNGALLVGDGDTVEGIYWEGGSTRVTGSATYTATDTTAPSVSGFTASNPTDSTIEVQFGSNEQLSTISVDLSGPETATLTKSDFSESSQNGGYLYTATYSAGTDGDYTATLNKAEDAAGNDGATSQSDTVTIGGGNEGGPSLPPAPHVSFGSNELSTSGYTSLFVILNADGEVDSVADLELRFYNTTESSSTPVVTKTDLNTIKGFEMLTVPKSELGAKQFSGKIELVDTSSSTVLDSASKTVYVYDNVSTSMSETTLDDSADSGIDVSYDLGNIDPNNAEIIVQTTTLNSGFTTKTKSVSGSSGTVTVDVKASDVNRNFTANAFVRDTSRSRQVQSSFSRTCIATTNSPCPRVQSTSVTYTNGTAVSGVEVATEFNWFRNGLDFYLHPTGEPDTKELTGVSGLDRNTEINVTLTLDSFDPTFVMGTANAEEWDREKVGGGTYEFTTTLQPAEVYWNDKVENPDPNEWPLKNASANVHYDAIVDMSVISLDNSFAEKVQGGMVVTDAQAFGPPQYKAPKDGNPGKLKITVAAPHYETDGSTVNSGFYTAIIPSGITSEWGVDGSQLTASYGSESLASKVDTLDSGAIKLATDIHYSSGTVTVSGDSSKPVAKTGSDKTTDEDTSVSFDGTGSSDEGSIDKYEWDFDGDGTTDATGATPTHTFADPGTYDVVLTVTDNDGKSSTNTVTVTVADVTDPSAAAGSDTTATEDTAVSFDATSSSDNGQITSYAWDFDGDGTTDSTKRKPTHTFADPGTYDVVLTVTDGGGNTATDTVTVSVTAASDSSDGSSSGGSSGSASTGGAGASEAATVTVTERDGVANVHVDGGAGTREVDLGAGDGRGVRVDGLSIDTSAGSFTLNVSGHAEPPESAPVPNRTDVGDATAGYLQIDHSVADEDISGVTITFSVGWDALANGTTASEVVLYRYHDGAWQPLETELTGYTENGARFEATSPGLSVFAVGQRKAADIAVEPTLATDTATVGESVAVTARVSNDGTATGMTTVGLRVDGAIRDTESVTLDPGQSTTVELGTTFDATGSYDIVVEGVDAGSVTVTEADGVTSEPTATAGSTPTAGSTATATQTPTPSDAPTPDEGPESVASPTATPTDSAGGPGFGAGLAVVAVLAAAAALARRRD